MRNENIKFTKDKLQINVDSPSYTEILDKYHNNNIHYEHKDMPVNGSDASNYASKKSKIVHFANPIHMFGKFWVADSASFSVIMLPGPFTIWCTAAQVNIKKYSDPDSSWNDYWNAIYASFVFSAWMLIFLFVSFT